MNSETLVIRIKYNPNESSHVAIPKNEIDDLSEWDVKRILVALIVLLSIVGALVYFVFSSVKTVQNVQDAVAISQKPVKPELPDHQVGSDSFDREQKNNLNNRSTHNDQDLKQTVSSSGKPIDLEKPTTERKKSIGNPNITRSRFTSGIKHKEPVDNLTSPFFALHGEAYRIYFFTELKRSKGHAVTHVWKHNGQVKVNKEFEIRGNRWRIYTSKLLNMTMLGQWDVSVIDSNGQILTQKSFELKAPLER